LLVLGIETSTALGSVGVVEAFDGPGVGAVAVLSEVTRDSGLRHGAALLGLVDEALLAAGREIEDLDAVAVSIGPGSFTGLRVALATAKGLVLGTTTRLVGVPTLDALSEAVCGRVLAAGPGALPAGTLLAPCLDARRGEVYGACHAWRPRGSGGVAEPLVEVEPPGAFAPAAFGRRIATLAGDSPVLLFGEGATRYRAVIESEIGRAATFLGDPAGSPSGAAVATMGARGGGSPGDVARLGPLYVRASEAERHRAAAQSGGPGSPPGEGSGSR
jgi:tRNA threonylcarbamoyladenosine biosynthesis protein TsaB